MKISNKVLPSILILFMIQSLGGGLLSQSNLFAGCGVSKVAPITKTKFAKVAPMDFEEDTEAVSAQLQDLVLEDIEGCEPVETKKIGFNDLPLEVICEIVNKIKKQEDILAFAAVSPYCFFAYKICKEKDIKRFHEWLLDFSCSDVFFRIHEWLLDFSCSDVFFRKEKATEIFLWLVRHDYSLLIREFLNKYKNNNVALKDAFSSRCFYEALSMATGKNSIELVKIFMSNPEVMERFLKPCSFNVRSQKVCSYSVGPQVFFSRIVGNVLTTSRNEIIELFLMNEDFFNSLEEFNFRAALLSVSYLNVELCNLLKLAIKLKAKPNWREEANAKYVVKGRK